MLDPETVLTELYVLADEFCKDHAPPGPRPGPVGGLATSEVVTLAVSAQATRFPSERAFHRHASRPLRPLFPGRPSRDRCNRVVRAAGATIAAFALAVGGALAVGDERGFEAIDGMGRPTRNAKRRGAGWRWGQADSGWCTRVGWYDGGRLLVGVTPAGVVTGWGIGPAATNDRVLAETCFAARAAPPPGRPGVGRPTSDRYVAAMGVSGKRCQARWAAEAGAVVVSPPQSDRKRAWPKPLRTWLAGIRQVVEAVNDRVRFACGRDRERPHALDGLQARLAAAIGLHNVRCWLNWRHGRGPLRVADLLDW